MKSGKYLIAVLKRLMPYADVWFIAYILKYFIFTNNPKVAAIIFLVSWLAFFAIATKDFLIFWKGHFCTGMVPDEQIFSCYISLTSICLAAQCLAFFEFRTIANMALLTALLFVNLISVISINHYFFLIFFAFNYFLFFFRIAYLIKYI
ncbi:MAG TPA: hypothetical protein PKK26_12085 [Candidatus Wallbacteria bacterium]|nr:hypothetical protein [Candidatus Wallbacteria bacterium]